MTSILCFYFFCRIIFDFPPLEPIWDIFGDCKDYLVQSKANFCSTGFFMPSPHPGFSPRPFTIPLFYKLAGSDPVSIVWMQKILYSISVLVFVNSVLLVVNNKVIRIALLPVVYYFFTWWVIVGFTENLLSESLSMSFLFLWLAGLILLVHFKNKYLLILTVVISLLFSFTRDTWPYIILLANGLLLAAFYRKEKQLKNYLVVLNACGLFVFFIQSHTATVGERYKIPVYNVLATRISKNPGYVTWFKDKGMPLADSLVLNLSHTDPENKASVLKLYESYTDPTYKPLQDWIMKEGKSTYMLFMITHPSYFFLQDQTKEEKARIFSLTNEYYLPEKGHYEDVKKVFPYFSLTFLLCTVFVLTVLGFVIKPLNTGYFLPCFLVLLFVANVFLSYNADTFEVKRHLFITQVMIQLTSILSLALLIDSIFVLLNKFIPLYFPLRKEHNTDL